MINGTIYKITCLTFNRTSMELKHLTAELVIRFGNTFNRTSMELKQAQFNG